MMDSIVIVWCPPLDSLSHFISADQIYSDDSIALTNRKWLEMKCLIEVSSFLGDGSAGIFEHGSFWLFHRLPVEAVHAVQSRRVFQLIPQHSVQPI